MKKLPALTPNQRKWLRRGIELLVVLVIIMGVRAWQQRDMVSGAAPLLQGLTLEQRQLYRLPDHPAQPVLVHFWATWCPICRTEQGSIDSLSRAGYPVVTVAMQSGSDESVRKFMAEQQLSFPVINDADGVLSAEWGVHAVPASFIIDRNGQIRFVEIGFTTGWGLRLRMWVAGLLS
ncbi:MAG TPA: protein disulfide oxidoreductase [Gallionellaceae bacterium]